MWLSCLHLDARNSTDRQRSIGDAVYEFLKVTNVSLLDDSGNEFVQLPVVDDALRTRRRPFAGDPGRDIDFHRLCNFRLMWKHANSRVKSHCLERHRMLPLHSNGYPEPGAETA